MKIAVIGAGAMGAMFGAKLARSGNKVFLVDIWKEHVDVINEKGLLLKYKGSGGEYIPVKAVLSVKEVPGPVELIIIFVKGMYTETAVNEAKDLISSDTHVLTLQNGLGNADIISKYVEPSKVIMGATKDCATLIQPGIVNDTTEKLPVTTEIVSFDKSITPELEEVAETLTKAGIGTEVSASAEVDIWKKLIINCCVNAPCMLTRLNMSIMTNDPYGSKLCHELIHEICTVASKKGINIDPEQMHAFIKDYYKESAHHPSMSQDAYKKIKTEIETITGAVVREAAKYSVPVPVNETFYNLIKLVENNYDKLWY